MIVPRDLPVHYYPFYAIQKVHFIITLILLGSQNERYNEVAVYFTNRSIGYLYIFLFVIRQQI